MISTVIMAFVSFVSTNIDDIVILMLFFTQTNNIMKIHHVVIGQYLGIGVLTIVSIIGALGVSVVPDEYVGLLGLVPIYLGIKAYVDHKKDDNKNEEKKDTQVKNDTQENRKINVIRSFINPSIFKVFSLTLANGGDNIGIYIPLFAGKSLVDILVTVIIFIMLTALWCFIGLRLSKHSFVKKNIEKYQHIFVPIIFICLGISILIKNGTISFLCLHIFS
ncbi:cadmium resistance transporter [Clostridium lacusfryxellense]|uniref:cadmium resistance transporter n=1 Tax=Clostridium lacusfryxellense TaxID=205328 RepID=UPI001C0DEF5A|nr:cadmium resistance transporter [Clostridium lacusfryxellense]MBU3110272.1 cadmium resistance transporter [Clostridium lacusfryxellense]